MNIVILKETHPDESRAAIDVQSLKKLLTLTDNVIVESGIGESIGCADDVYSGLGAKVEKNRDKLLSEADVILRIRKPTFEEVAKLKKGSIHISFLDPYNEKDLITAFQKQGVSAISIEMIPRSTKAQKMDVLSSQASLAGYVAIMLAANESQKIFPMMMTPSGTISPSRVFIIGAGVAGLQAIATAKRLGARVDAFDTRPVVEEQVQSLGAKFVKVDLGDTGQTKDGYAKALTPEQLDKQREAMATQCEKADIVVTTAQLFGRKAPLIITEDIIKKMMPGSVLVDLAVETGGNVFGSKVNETVDIHGVKVIGLANLPGRVAVHASQMLGANFTSLLEEFWDKEEKKLSLDFDNDVLKGCLITYNNELVNETIKSFYMKGN